MVVRQLNIGLQHRGNETPPGFRRPKVDIFVPGSLDVQVHPGSQHDFHALAVPRRDQIQQRHLEVRLVIDGVHHLLQPEHPAHQIGAHPPAADHQQVAIPGVCQHRRDLPLELGCLRRRGRLQQVCQRRQVLAPLDYEAPRACFNVIVQEWHMIAVRPLLVLAHLSPQYTGRGVIFLDQDRPALVRRHFLPLLHFHRRVEAHRQAVQVISIRAHHRWARRKLDKRIQSQVKLSLDKVKIILAFGQQPLMQHEADRRPVGCAAFQRCQHTLP